MRGVDTKAHANEEGYAKTGIRRKNSAESPCESPFSLATPRLGYMPKGEHTEIEVRFRLHILGFPDPGSQTQDSLDKTVRKFPMFSSRC